MLDDGALGRAAGPLLVALFALVHGNTLDGILVGG